MEDRSGLILGSVMILASFLMPILFNVNTVHVQASLMDALALWEKTGLLEAALRLVLLNSIRAIPHYVGAFFIGESLRIRLGRYIDWPLNAILIVVLLRLTYRGIGAVHGIHYDFGLPAVLVSAFVVFFRKLHYRYISHTKKALLIALVLTAFQFLDVMPVMGVWPVGRGELSWDIKLAANLMLAEPLLNVVAAVGMLLFILFSMLIFFQLRDENTLRELSILKEQNQSIRLQAQLNEMKNRTNQEIQYLVHDLKSPLTAMQTLVGVLKMESEMDGRAQDVEYLSRIEVAGEQMNRMISEILYADSRSPITTQALLEVVLAQSSVTDYAPYLHVDNRAPEVRIRANRMLFPRVLINLLQNSARAIPPERVPNIWLRVNQSVDKDGPKITFSVSDNGRGIDREQQDVIWDRGVSNQNSSGLGLAFVRSIVDQMDGEIHLESKKNEGTTISIILPQEEDTQ